MKYKEFRDKLNKLEIEGYLTNDVEILIDDALFIEDIDMCLENKDQKIKNYLNIFSYIKKIKRFSF